MERKNVTIHSDSTEINTHIECTEMESEKMREWKNELIWFEISFTLETFRVCLSADGSVCRTEASLPNMTLNNGLLIFDWNSLFIVVYEMCGSVFKNFVPVLTS